ncbi:MAG: hypothetical protein Q9220_005834 [cf. Caloplaca sp. 1 TL-2023]
MNAIIQGQLDRVEGALNNLVTSIESYNPSVPAAIDLLAADTELQQGVKLLTQHQQKYARILHLRSAIEAQEQRTKDKLTLLAETCKELHATHITTFPENSRNVPYAELLDYANKISRYTVPPTFREPLPKPQLAAGTVDNDPTKEEENAVSAPPPSTNGISGGSDAVAEAREVNAIANGEPHPSTSPRDEGGGGGGGEKSGVGVSSLEQSEVQWLNPLKQIPFVPWPTEEVIKRGGLGQIQVMLEQGIDPSGAGDTRGEEEGAEIGQKEEVAGQKRQEDVQMGEGGEEAAAMDVDHSRVGGGERMAEGQSREQKPKVFKGLDLDEDSDDE